MEKRWTAIAVIVGYTVVLGALTLMAPIEALARKSSVERLAEEGYAALTADGPVRVESAGELARR
jgi:hypothetical protein